MKKTPISKPIKLLDETALFSQISKIIETRKNRAGTYANQEITLMYWEIGRYIRLNVLNDERADYGKQIVPTLAIRLVNKYGKSFELRNLRRYGTICGNIS
jgi:hypothetical protein